MYFKEDAVADFHRMFQKKKQTIKAQDGCNYLELIEGITDKTIISTYSIWESQEHLDAYRHSTFFGETWKETKSYFRMKAEARSYHLVEKMD